MEGLGRGWANALGERAGMVHRHQHSTILFGRTGAIPVAAKPYMADLTSDLARYATNATVAYAV